MRRIAVVAFCLTSLVTAVLQGEPASRPSTQPAAADGGLVVELIPAKERYKAGEAVAIRVVLRNGSHEPITVLAPVDGSDIEWRQVQYLWGVARPGGPQLAQMGMMRCGNINPLTTADRVVLRPGETYEPMGAERSFLQPVSSYFQLGAGTYEVSLTYAFDPVGDVKGLPLGEDEPEALKGVTPTRVTSPAVTVVVEP